MEKTLFLLLAFCVSCVYSQCSTTDVSSLTTCTTAFKTSVGSSSNCTQLTNATGCTAYNNLVTCVNSKQVNNASCGIVSKVDELLNITCKIASFKTTCTNVTAVINETPLTTTVSSTTTQKATSTSEILKPEITLFLFVLSLVLFNKLFP